MIKLDRFVAAVKCRFPAKAVGMSVALVSALTISTSVVVGFTIGMGELNVFEFTVSNCLVASLIYMLIQINNYPHMRDFKEHKILENEDQVLDRCLKHLHDIASTASAALIVIVLIMTCWSSWFAMQITFGFYDWINR